MPLLHLQQGSLAFGHLPLVENADLRVEPGERIALIGRNGSGKSSLLKAIAGEIPLDTGTIWRAPGLRVARLEQEVPGGAADRTVFDEVSAGLGSLGEIVAAYHHAAIEVAEHPHDPDRLERMSDLQHALERDDGWSLEERVELVIAKLGLPADRPVGALSGGWRRRTLLAKALVSNPDLLLLDEPTNHLDIDAIQWVEEFLRDFAGAVLFVTHDRAFLSNLATRIVDLDRGALTSWPGSYPVYLEKKSAALDSEARDLDRLDKKLAQEEIWLRQGVKARRTRNEGRVRALESLRLERAARRDEVARVKGAIQEAERSGRAVLRCQNLGYAYGDAPIVRGYTGTILRGDRIGILGPNGCGKTTLIRLLLGELAPQEGTVAAGTRLEVAHFEQLHDSLDESKTVIQNIGDGGDTVSVGGTDRHVVGYLRDFLFSPEQIQGSIARLSGGERKRLQLAKILSRPCNLLVLDEPTNDLDLETLELLESLLLEFQGTLLIVSHDRDFLDNVVTSTLVFEGAGQWREYVGGYADWLRQKQVAEPPSVAKAARPKQERNAVRPRRAGFKEKREMEELPGTIEKLEIEKQDLFALMASPDFYTTRGEELARIRERLAAVEAELHEAYTRWMELETRGHPGHP